MKETERELAIHSGRIIKTLRKEHGLTQQELGKKVGVSGSAIANYEKGFRAPLQDTLFALAECFDVSVNEFFPYKQSDSIIGIYNKLNEHRQRKVYSFAEYQLEEQNNYIGTTAAGSPIEGEQVPIVYGDQNDVSLLVSGDSMEELYKNGDVITYRKQPTLENGEIGVFVLNGGVTMKRFKNNGDIRLQSLNSKYQDIIVTDADDFAILGKVIS